MSASTLLLCRRLQSILLEARKNTRNNILVHILPPDDIKVLVPLQRLRMRMRRQLARHHMDVHQTVRRAVHEHNRRRDVLRREARGAQGEERERGRGGEGQEGERPRGRDGDFMRSSDGGAVRGGGWGGPEPTPARKTVALLVRKLQASYLLIRRA